jgi:5-methylcytosine-specific restriction endonuclease McrA
MKIEISPPECDENRDAIAVQCVLCSSTKNLHFDHDIPFSKGGSSLTAANVRLLCAKHNLEKSDKILTIAPWIFAGTATIPHIQKISG